MGMVKLPVHRHWPRPNRDGAEQAGTDHRDLGRPTHGLAEMRAEKSMNQGPTPLTSRKLPKIKKMTT
jgi:hypothetical protein